MAIFIYTLQYTINVNIIKVNYTISVDTFFSDIFTLNPYTLLFVKLYLKFALL